MNNSPALRAGEIAATRRDVSSRYSTTSRLGMLPMIRLVTLLPDVGVGARRPRILGTIRRIRPLVEPYGPSRARLNAKPVKRSTAAYVIGTGS